MRVRLVFLRVISVLLSLVLFGIGLSFFSTLNERIVSMEDKLEQLSAENQKNSEAIEELKTAPPVGIGIETQDYIGNMLAE